MINAGNTKATDIRPINIPSTIKGNFIKDLVAPISCSVMISSRLEKTESLIVL